MNVPFVWLTCVHRALLSALHECRYNLHLKIQSTLYMCILVHQAKRHESQIALLPLLLLFAAISVLNSYNKD